MSRVADSQIAPSSFAPLPASEPRPFASSSPSSSAATDVSEQARSLERRRANRANAKKSTGPRSAEGKQRASRNAISHGLFCRDVILPGESDVEFLRLRLSFHASLRAGDAVEFAIIERLVLAQWRLRRCQSAETDLHRSAPRRIVRRQMGAVTALAGRGLNSAITLLANAANQKDDQDETVEPSKRSKTPGQTMAMDLEDSQSALERLSRYEHRLEHDFYKALRELRAGRKAGLPPAADDAFMAGIGAYPSLETMQRQLRECEHSEAAGAIDPAETEVKPAPAEDLGSADESGPAAEPRRSCEPERSSEPKSLAGTDTIDSDDPGVTGDDDAPAQNEAKLAAVPQSLAASTVAAGDWPRRPAHASATSAEAEGRSTVG